MYYFLQQLINGVTLGAMYGLIAIGYSMVYGIIGMINFAHGEIYMIGAFLSIISFTVLGMLGITWVPLALVVVLLIAMAFTSAYGWTVERLDWAGLFSQAPIAHRMESALDVLAERFEARMAYASGERDMVLLRHEFVSTWRDGFRAPRRTVSRLVAYGRPADGTSATSRTVSLPAAVAAERILAGKIDLVGVHIPIDPEIYDPVLDALEDEGILFEESHEPA